VPATRQEIVSWRGVELREEEPVVEKRTVPKERVRLDVETVSEDREVSETVRKEQIEVDEGRDRDA
jgi:stress response protein YsnF